MMKPANRAFQKRITARTVSLEPATQLPSIHLFHKLLLFMHSFFVLHLFEYVVLLITFTAFV